MVRFKTLSMVLGGCILSVLGVFSQTHAQDTHQVLQQHYPNVAAAIHGSDPTQLQSALDGLAPQDRQRVLTSLHTQGVTSSFLQGAPLTEGPGGNGGAGGASLANFTELMRLIETVIDAPWANNGGTATMFPFRNGVRIDPNGLIERFEDVEQEDAPKLKLAAAPARELAQPSIRLDDLGEWQRSSALRWVSLHQLDAQLEERRQRGEHSNVALELLGGLCRIDYVAFDRESKEWMIGGPAGSIAANRNGELLHTELLLPPILLEDLLTIAPQVLNGGGEFGCSIDPVQERLVAAYQMARAPASIRELRNDPEEWAKAWKSKLGRQRVNVVGIPDDSPTGYALLIADAHMKRVALGLEPSPPDLKNYWLESDLAPSGSQSPMVRWWFTLSSARIPWDPDRKIAHFAHSNVQVMSEAQMLSKTGERVVADRKDWAADTFAKNFSARFDSLQRSYPIYGRLRHVFDLAVALEIVRSQIDAGVGKRFQCLQRAELQPHLPTAPREIDSVVSTRKGSDGSISAIVSGGVSVQPKTTRERIRIDKASLTSVPVEASPGERDLESNGLEKPFWR